MKPKPPVPLWRWGTWYVALGAASEAGSVAGESVVDGFWFGLSKRSWQFS